jgi:hypothetical protein
VIVVGNSASGRDIGFDLVPYAESPVYVSRRSRSRWEGDEPPPGIAWTPVIKEYQPDGRVVFEDGTYLDDVDTVIYCTGYKPSFPFWNEKKNGRPLWDYQLDRLKGNFWHTFFQDYPTLGIVGLPRTLTFRSFEYQAIALARVFSKRNSIPLPAVKDQEIWELERAASSRFNRTRFHDIPWENGETTEYLDFLFELAGLGTLKGDGMIPPTLGKDLVWALEHLRKYPDHGKEGHDEGDQCQEQYGNASGESHEDDGWVLVRDTKKDLLAFI